VVLNLRDNQSCDKSDVLLRHRFASTIREQCQHKRYTASATATATATASTDFNQSTDTVRPTLE
jgi:hypothetical protein